MTGFIIYGLPRSRTFWLSRFLSYGEWTCGHDEMRHARSVEDVKAWFSQPYTGTVETAAAPWWRAVEMISPGLRTVVIRRDLDEVLGSLMNTGIPFDLPKLKKSINALNRKLDQIERRVSGVLSVQFDDLKNEDVCSIVFERCLQIKHNTEWWKKIAPINLQCDLRAQIRYCVAYSKQLEKLGHQAKRLTLISFGPRKPVNRDDVTIQQESCEAWLRDGEKLFQEHSVLLGEMPNDYLKKNWALMSKMDAIGAMQIMTARCNGRMVGYYVCYVGPATDDASVMSSLQISTFVSKDFSGLATRLQRASLESLRSKGVGEVFFRAGIRADGARIGALYQRAGAECIGQMYRLQLKGA